MAPEDRPTKKPTIRLIRLPVAPPTAARASLPTYLPTMMASAVLYSCWKNVPSRMGKKKISSCFQMTPSMMLFPAAAWAGRRLLNIAFSCSFAYLPAHFIAYPARFVQGGKQGCGLRAGKNFFGKGTSHCKRTPKHCKYADFHVKCGQKKDACTIIDAHGGGRGHERL